MAALRRVISVVQILGIFVPVTVSSSHPDIMESNVLSLDTMNEQLESFFDSIGLTASDARTFRDKFDTSRSVADGSPQPFMLEGACLVAELCLGSSKVDRAPLNETNVKQNWSEACVAEPRCIIHPETVEDVSKTLRIISFCKVRFAVRSGGHSPNPGWSSIEQGILLDMQRMNQIALSDDKQVASLGPGCRWGDVITTLDAQGTTVIGGRMPPVGVAGLILGGGLFHFSGEYGLAADNVKNFEVVLADGAVVDANSDSISDLFWALKGGGPNFGIVTRFDLYTVPVKEVWSQLSIYSLNQAYVLLDAFVQWQNEGAADLKSTVALTFGLDTVTLGLLYSEPTEQPEPFAPFYDIEPLMVPVPANNGTITTITTILGSTLSSEPARHDYRGASSRIDAQLYKDVYTFWREKAVAMREETGANQSFTLQPIPKGLAEAGEKRGGNPMNIPTENHQWWTTLINWEKASDDEKVRSVSIETTAKWQQLGQERGLDLPFVFMNDASRDQNPLASYGQENLERLRQISLKYDEKQLFQKLQNDGFLLSKA